MKKHVALMLVLILGLMLPHASLAYSLPVESIQKPNIPQNIVLQGSGNQQTPSTPNNDQCVGQNPQELEEPCCGQAAIVIDSQFSDADLQLQDALTNYSDLSASTYFSNLGIKTFNSQRNRYELCFSFPDTAASVRNTITITAEPGETKGLAVYDLNLLPGSLSVGDSLLEVNFSTTEAKPVSLINLSMSNVVEGLLVESKTDIDNAEIKGVGGGACVEYNGVGASGSYIKGSTISGCFIGILIDGSNDVFIGASTAQDFYQADGTTLKDANLISQNEQFGIHLINGHRDKFGFNSIYGNSADTQDAITIEDGMNDNILPPVVDLLLQSGKEFVVRCDKDANGNLVRRYIKFDYTAGSIQLYEADLATKQAWKFIANCNLSTNGECDLTTLPSWMPITSNQCGVSENDDYLITAMYTSSGSSSLMEPKNLSGPVVIFAESEGVEVPTAPAEDSGGDEVSLVSGATGTSEGGGGEIVALGAKGGCMGGSSLLPNNVESTYAPHLGMWWIIFSIALLASMRFAKVRASRRSNGKRIRSRFNGGYRGK